MSYTKLKEKQMRYIVLTTNTLNVHRIKKKNRNQSFRFTIFLES